MMSVTNKLITIPRIFCLSILLFLFLQATGQTSTRDPLTIPDQDSILGTLNPDHPRIILTDEKLGELKFLYDSDQDLQAMVDSMISRADGYLNHEPLEYNLIGPRLLSVSTACVDRTRILSLAWRWTDDCRYADKAVENLIAVCAFPDWNPSHFLDTAEMSHAVGLGYDWLNDYLDDETKEILRDGLIRHGITPALSAYEENRYSFPTRQNNWNQVCNGGMIIGALAIADEEPDIAARIVHGAVNSLPVAMDLYAPDGAWMEGPGYWYYASRYAAYAFSALETSLGTDFGLSQTPGFSESGYFPIYLAGPTGRLLAFADCSEGASLASMPCQFFLSSTFDIPLLSFMEHEMSGGSGKVAENLMWYVPKPEFDITSLPLDQYFDGPVEVVSMRSSWDDPNALFVGIKAGFNQVPHGHLDLGNFEFDMAGVRWAVDIGRDDYNLPGYWRGGIGGQRWNYYRLRSISHNIPVINNSDQDPMATSTVTRSQLNCDDPFAIIEIDGAWDEFSDRIIRGVRLLNERTALLVQDEFNLTESCEVTWGITTAAEIEIREDGAAILTQDGKSIVASILSPEGVQFSVESAEQEPPEKQNEGYSRLEIKMPDKIGQLTIIVLFSEIAMEPDRLPVVQAIDQW